MNTGDYIFKVKAARGYNPVVITPQNGMVLGWSGGVLTNVTRGSGGTGAVWGLVTGTLAAQTDLANAMSLKADNGSPNLTGTAVTDNLVVGGTLTFNSSTTFNFDSSAKAAFKTAMGLNTIVGITGTKSQFDAAVSNGNFAWLDNDNTFDGTTSFIKAADTTLISQTTTGTAGYFSAIGTGNAIIAETTSGAAYYGAATTGTAAYFESGSGTALYAVSSSGNHADFGDGLVVISNDGTVIMNSGLQVAGGILLNNLVFASGATIGFEGSSTMTGLLEALQVYRVVIVATRAELNTVQPFAGQLAIVLADGEVLMSFTGTYGTWATLVTGKSETSPP